MDVISHGLWTTILARVVNKKTTKRLNSRFFVFMGVFPDLFAFAPLFGWLIYNLLFGGSQSSHLPEPEAIEPARGNSLLILELTPKLYTISHSLIVFFLVFGLLCLLKRRIILEMTGWLLHVLIDVPTHTYQFYPTPVLWPLSEWKFNGFSWAEPWFLVFNYSLLLIVFFWLKIKKRPI